MKRRNEEGRALTVEDLPPELREFDPAAWGWSGPHYADGDIVTGFAEAWRRFLGQRTAWCDQHPTSDWFEDVRRRHPDEPWGVSSI